MDACTTRGNVSQETHSVTSDREHFGCIVAL